MTFGVRLAVWSGPRSISTALMRSWESRPDCKVVDEPLYASYLSHNDADHPGREDVIAAGETSCEAVIADLTEPVNGVYYQKHMAHHLVPGLRRDWIASLTNVLLIRHPTDVVASYQRARASVQATDLGLLEQNQLYEQFDGGLPVIDAADFLGDPEAYLRWMCTYAGVPFTQEMLTWESGPRDSDGVWARHWYRAVLCSTGFQPYRHRSGPIDDRARAVVGWNMPYYERLAAVRLVV
jgi:Sulfotransferase domain